MFVLLRCLFFIIGFSYALDSLGTTHIPQSKKTLPLSTTQKFSAEKWEGRSESLQKFLSTQPGFYLREAVGQGGHSQVSWRGMSSEYFWIEFQGIPLNSSEGSSVSFQQIPLAWINQFSMHQGILPSELPSGYFAALELTPSSEPSNQLQNTFYLPYAHSWDLRLQFADHEEFGSHFFHGESFSNQFEYKNRHQTPYNAADDTWEELENAESLQFSSFHSFPLGNDHWKLSLYEYQNHGGMYGAEGRPTVSASYQNLTLASSLQYRDEQRKLKFVYKFQNLQSKWNNEDNLYRFSSSSIHLRNYIHWLQPQFTQNFKLPHLPLTFTFAPSWEWYLPRHLSTANQFLDWQALRTQWQSNVMAPILFSQHQFKFRLGINYLKDVKQIPSDPNYHKDEAYLLYEYGTEYSFQSHFGLIDLVYANNYKVAGLAQKFGGSRGSLANPDLSPEQIQLYQIKYATSFYTHTFSSTLYLQDVENKLTPQRSSQLIKWTNAGKTRIAGVESQLDINLAPAFWTLQYSLNQSQDRGKEPTYRYKSLPDTPQFSGNSEWGFHYFGWKPWIQIHYLSSTFRDRANLIGIPSALRWHTGIRYVSGSFEASMRCNNLTGEYYENAYSSFPYPKREWALTLKTLF